MYVRTHVCTHVRVYERNVTYFDCRNHRAILCCQVGFEARVRLVVTAGCAGGECEPSSVAFVDSPDHLLLNSQPRGFEVKVNPTHPALSSGPHFVEVRTCGDEMR